MTSLLESCSITLRNLSSRIVLRLAELTSVSESLEDGIFPGLHGEVPVLNVFPCSSDPNVQLRSDSFSSMSGRLTRYQQSDHSRTA